MSLKYGVSSPGLAFASLVRWFTVDCIHRSNWTTHLITVICDTKAQDAKDVLTTWNYLASSKLKYIWSWLLCCLCLCLAISKLNTPLIYLQLCSPFGFSLGLPSGFIRQPKILSSDNHDIELVKHKVWTHTRYFKHSCFKHTTILSYILFIILSL